MRLIPSSAQWGCPMRMPNLSTDVLMYADLNGVDSHGVSNTLRMYVQGYQAGNINPNPEMRIIRESNVTASFDGDGGLGLHPSATGHGHRH